MPRSSPDALGCAAALAAGRSFAVLLKLPPSGAGIWRDPTLPQGDDE
jgi:hypothetical protein